jgi:hypothetical protein
MFTTDHQTDIPSLPIQPVSHLHPHIDPTDRHLVQGYTKLVTDRVDEGWTCYLITFLFSQLPGRRSAVIGQMRDEVQRVYSTFLTRVHREPRRAPPDELTILVGVADLPVYKRDRSSSPVVLCNGGLHFHAVLMVPPGSRLRESVDEHFRSNEGLYRGKRKIISAVHVRPVTDSHDRVVDYVFKTVLRGSLSYDDAVLVLPRAGRELTTDGLLVGQRVGLPS